MIGVVDIVVVYDASRVRAAVDAERARAQGQHDRHGLSDELSRQLIPDAAWFEWWKDGE
jgi:hypothetical protein